MIKINLSKNKKTAAFTSVSESGFEANPSSSSGLVNLFLIFLIPALLAIYETQTIPAKKIEMQKVNKEKIELQQLNRSAVVARDQIKKLMEQEQKISQQVQTLSSLKIGREKEVRVLDLLQTQIPDQVWLTQIELKERTLRISCYGAKDSDVNTFLEKIPSIPSRKL